MAAKKIAKRFIRPSISTRPLTPTQVERIKKALDTKKKTDTLSRVSRSVFTAEQMMPPSMVRDAVKKESISELAATSTAKDLKAMQVSLTEDRGEFIDRLKGYQKPSRHTLSVNKQLIEKLKEALALRRDALDFIDPVSKGKKLSPGEKLRRAWRQKGGKVVPRKTGKKVGTTPPRPKRKPTIIISGPSRPKDPDSMKIDLNLWGVPNEHLKGSELRKTWEAKRSELESREGGNKVMRKKSGGKVVSKRGGGMSRVGLSPAEMSRAGTMSEAERARYMQAGGPIHTTFPEKAVPREKVKKPAAKIFPKVVPKKHGGSPIEKKKQGYKAREDESVAQRVKKKKKKRTKKQFAASRDESYGKWGTGKGKGKINRISSKQTDGSKLVDSLYDTISV